MSTFLGIVFIGIFIWALQAAFRSETHLRKYFWMGLVLKCFAGVSVGILYTYYYKTGDTLSFFNNAAKLVSLAEKDFSSYVRYIFTSELSLHHFVDIEFTDKRAILMVKIVSVFCLLAFSNYWLVCVYMSVISFFGSWFLIRRINFTFPDATLPAVVAFLFFPSVTFWTSGLIKETLAMGGLYFLCGVLLDVWTNTRLTVVNVLLAVLSIFVLWSLKYYFAGIFLAIAGATMIYRMIWFRASHSLDARWSYLIWASILILLIAGVSFLHPNFHFHRLLEVLVLNYDAFVEFSDPGATIVFNNLEPTFASIVANSPKALVSGLYRPLFFDARNILAVLLSVENAVLLGLSLIAITYFRRIFSSRVSILLCAIVVYVILLAIFITLSTPNLGTLARYRVGYLPFFVFLILLAPPIVARLQKIMTTPAKGNQIVDVRRDQLKRL